MYNNLLVADYIIVREWKIYTLQSSSLLVFTSKIGVLHTVLGYISECNLY